MASINYATREISCKIVYYGPGLSGKTTNLQIIHKKIPVESKSEMVSLATETDRTLFFDFLPLDLGSIKGFATKFQLYTVPGQVYYNATRKLVLRGVDGVVFVADSQRDKMQENIDSLKNLQENLKEYGIDLGSVPFVLQYNKRDLPGIASIVELDQHLNWHKVPTFEAQAHQGIGVFTTLKAIGKIVIDTFNAKYTARQGTRRPSTLADQPGNPPPSAPVPSLAPVQTSLASAPSPIPSLAPLPRPMAVVPPLAAPPPRQNPPPLAPPVFAPAPSMPSPIPPRPMAPPVASSTVNPAIQPSIPAPYPTSPVGAPQFTGFNPPAPPPIRVDQLAGLQTDYFGAPNPPVSAPPTAGLQPSPAPIQPVIQPSPMPGLQTFNPSIPAPQNPPIQTPPLPLPSFMPSPMPSPPPPVAAAAEVKHKKSKIDGSMDASDLDAEIARYEKELSDQKTIQDNAFVSNPNVNPNLHLADPLASAFLTPEELTRLQGPDSYPTRRMPLGPGQP